MKLKLYQTIARYLLGLIYLFGAVDGFLGIFFGIYLTGKAVECSFLGVLKQTLFFWAFMKSIQLIGAVSLLSNYKPALGVALLTPISAVLCLFYFFVLHWYYAMTVVAVLNLVLLKAYWPSYRAMFMDYPMRAKQAEAQTGA